jgi:hypothetical protein
MELRMHLFKKLINVATRFMLKLSPEPPVPYYPSSKILDRTFKTLFHVYRVQNEMCDMYGDKNFGNLLLFAYRALLYLSEHDRYYRMWLAFMFQRISLELDVERKNMTLEELKRLQFDQWELPIFEAVTPQHFAAFRSMLFEMVTANTLPNLVRVALPQNGGGPATNKRK